VLLSTRRPHRRTIMNLFRKLKLELHLFQQYFTPHTPPSFFFFFVIKGRSICPRCTAVYRLIVQPFSPL